VQTSRLQVYEDSAQALGAKYKGRSAGSFGLGGCISFYPAKVLGCFGDGGAILTSDVGIYNTVKLMRDHGRGEDGNVSIWGYNSRLNITSSPTPTPPAFSNNCIASVALATPNTYLMPVYSDSLCSN
jgi:dTDP-4-amino-4,6-dideoxygalactose transaminase